jgi:hypothetical protein
MSGISVIYPTGLNKFIENTLKIDTMAEISILLKKETIFAYGEYRKNFNNNSFSRGTLSKCKLYKI